MRQEECVSISVGVRVCKYVCVHFVYKHVCVHFVYEHVCVS